MTNAARAFLDFRIPAATLRPSASTGNRYQIAAVQGEDIPRQGVAGLLDPDAVAGVEQDSGRNLEGLLRSVDDEHLLGLAAYGSSRSQIIRDRAAQGSRAHQIAVMDRLGVGGAAASRDQAGPDLARKFIECDLADPERSEVREPREPGRRRKQLTSPGDGPGGGIRGGAFGPSGPSGDEWLGKRGGNDRSGANTAFHIAFGQKLSVSIEYREA